jgi:hypothetical protein
MRKGLMARRRMRLREKGRGMMGPRVHDKRSIS